ncbi:dienelactone hydrolase family protein [Cupriavidus basilensis]
MWCWRPMYSGATRRAWNWATPGMTGQAPWNCARRPDVELAVKDIAATAGALRAQLGAGAKIAAVGYCFGGLLSYLSAAARPGRRGGPGYYGGGIQNNLKEARQHQGARCSSTHGALDAHIPAEAVEQVRAAVAGNPRAEIHASMPRPITASTAGRVVPITSSRPRWHMAAH